jgi:hypothetical protein
MKPVTSISSAYVHDGQDEEGKAKSVKVSRHLFLRRLVMHSKVIYPALFVCMLSLACTAQAQLLVPPIDNPSFEATDLGAGGGGQWVDYAE